MSGTDGRDERVRDKHRGEEEKKETQDALLEAFTPPTSILTHVSSCRERRWCYTNKKRKEKETRRDSKRRGNETKEERGRRRRFCLT